MRRDIILITHDLINDYFNQFKGLPDRNVFSEGFADLAEWSERQPWWDEFAVRNSLGADWRSTPRGDINLFVLNLYRFLNPLSPPDGMVSTVPFVSDNLEMSLPQHNKSHESPDSMVLAQERR